MTEFIWPVRVYYEDTDCGGVVYHANYLKFMERARTEFLRQRGFEQDELIRTEGVVFAVHAINLDYHRPARFNDLLRVSAHICDAGRSSVTFEQKIHRDDSEPELLCSGRIRIVCLDAAAFKPRPLPESMRGDLICEV